MRVRPDGPARMFGPHLSRVWEDVVVIPERFCIKISCDCCAASRSVSFDAEAVDRMGMSTTIEEALRDAAWELCGAYVFCPKCVERILARALADEVRTLGEKRPETLSDLEAGA